MNSPSSSATTLQPMRRWRLSDSDLYCSAMKMCRRPELMQLLSVKSMMRYGPPKYTAGFARSRVSGYSRSPGAAGQHHDEDVVEHASSLALQDDARRGAVGAGDAQRQAVHLVHARLGVREVQPLDDDDALRRAARGAPARPPS